MSRKHQWRSDSPHYIPSLYKTELRQLQTELTTERLQQLYTLWHNVEATDTEKQQAREELVLGTLPAVLKLAGSYPQLGFTEAVAEGNLAAVQAVSDFLTGYNPEKGPLSVPVLIAYVQTAVEHRLTEAQRQAESVVPMSRHKRNHQRKIERAKQQLANKGQEATPEAISAATGIGPNAVLDTEACRLQAVSLNDEVPGSKQKEGHPLRYQDVVPDPTVLTPEKLLGTEEGREYLRQVLKAHLNQRQYDVIAQSVGLDGEPLGYPEIAKKLGSKPVAIRLVASRAFKALRKIEGLEDLLRLLCASDRSYGRHQIVSVPLVRQQTPEQRERVNNRKLTPDQAKTIRERAAAGELGSELAKEFGVARTTVYALLNGRNWRRLKG